ncbi:MULTISPECIES: hypothetical protein [Rhodococcus]|uniref:hypothetical protein n=1 Tax=Rhodococcus TaxID=1827 RepID=UPI0004BCB477|nr:MULTISPECIES: hypothetical protein [Rhodococcus]WAM20091.1 hypothetical protein OYT95_41960 [Rhodococcus sp. JS3073]
MSHRTAADLERELAMLAYVRDRLRASEGEDFRIPTTSVDQVLDELDSLARSPWDPTMSPPPEGAWDAHAGGEGSPDDGGGSAGHLNGS